MARMTADEGVRAYMEGTPSSFIVPYNPQEHEEAMMDLITGLIGAMLKLNLGSLSGPELGSTIPVVVTNVPGDILRILIAPDITPYGPWYQTNNMNIKKAREFVKLTALSYRGDLLKLDTRYEKYLNYRGLGEELQYQKQLLDRLSISS